MPEHRSPYEAVLSGIPESLHPRLRTYFSAMPVGKHGYGEGVFATVGTPKRWLWPLIWLAGTPDILFPVWERDVPFTVINRPVPGRWPAIDATRVFELAAGRRIMTDAISASPDGLVDYLGARRRMRAHLTTSVRDGALHLASTGVAVRLGRRWVGIPAWLAPSVTLTERFSDDDARQHVAVAVTMPVIGTVYEYAGSFTYEIRSGEGAA